MPRIIWTEAAQHDLYEAYSFLLEYDMDAAVKAVKTITAGVKTLEKFPEAGRPAPDLEPEQRELLIGFGGSGYVALYVIEHENVLILAVRHQREVGY